MPDPHQLLPPGARRSIRTRGRPRTGPTSRAQSGEAATTQMLKVWNSTYYVYNIDAWNTRTSAFNGIYPMSLMYGRFTRLPAFIFSNHTVAGYTTHAAPGLHKKGHPSMKF